MSKEFFDIMQEIENKAKDLKFLENSHPEISSKFISPAKKMAELTLLSMKELDVKIKEDLKKIHSKSKVKNGRIK